MAEQEFELKLASGRVVKWLGKNGEDAAYRYVDGFPGTTVIAWRYPKFEFKVGMIRIID